MKLAFHVHTEYSSDCRMPLTAIMDVCGKEHIESIVITDHNTIAGALALARAAGPELQVVAGEEIMTREGEIIGIFLKTAVAPFQGLLKTMEDIRSQGGIVCVPHPFDRLRKGKINRLSMNKCMDGIDIIESYNSRNLFSADNRRAQELSVRNNKIQIAGSDAHTEGEIRNAIIEIRPFASPEEFEQNLRGARMILHRCAVRSHVITKTIKVSNKYLRGPLKRYVNKLFRDHWRQTHDDKVA